MAEGDLVTYLGEVIERLDRLTKQFNLQVSDPQRVQATNQVLAMNPDLIPVLDDYTALVAAALQAPLCLVNMLSADVLTALSCFGSDFKEGKLRHTFCQYVAGSGHPFMVTDADQHLLVRDMEVVVRSELPIKSYYGAPIFFDNQCVGALCVADHVPRTWTTDQVDLVDQYAKRVTQILEEFRG